MNSRAFLLCALFGVTACTSLMIGPYDFTYIPINTEKFEIATWQHVTSSASPIHIYIEGDGYAFDKHGHPTRNPTPRKKMVRDWAARDTADNVVYMARPCQYIKGPNCDVSDWTNGRFSADIIKSMHDAIATIAKGRPIILIGYSGGAMVSGLVIQKYPDLNIQKWVTVAGVLNHADWTEHFNDSPLDKSLNMNKLPHIAQVHYIAKGDNVVPNELSRKWAQDANIIVVEDARHDSFPGLKLNLN